MVVPALSDDDDASPTLSVGLLTPPQLPLGYGRSEPILVSGAEHGNGDGMERRAGYHNASPAMSPLLKPVQTTNLKQKSWTSHLLRNSPPTTPKGHPVVEEGYFTSTIKVRAFPIWSSFSICDVNGNTDVQSMYPIAKPSGSSKYPASVSWYTRIPRRYRPVLVIALCLVSFFCIYATHSDTDAPAYPQEEELDVGRRFVETTQWETEHHTGAAHPDMPPAIELSPEDEYAALLGVSSSFPLASDTLVR